MSGGNSLVSTIIREGLNARHGLPPYIYEIEDEKTKSRIAYLNYAAYADFLKNHFNIVYFNKTIYLYDHGLHFYRKQTNEIETHIRDTCISYSIKGKLVSHITELKSHITSMGCYTEYPFNLSSDSIPVENGIVKINYTDGSIELDQHGSSHMFTYKLSVVYDPSIRNCDAISLLKRMVEPDHIKTLIQIPAQALLQMQMGHAYKKAYLLQGEPHAGKTSYLKLLYEIFGAEFRSSISLQQLCEDRFVGGNLEGKLLNIYDDLEDVALEVIDQFKTMTGDCNHGIERKYEIKYTGRVTAVHIFTCNYPPEYPAKVKRDTAFWARWEYLKFPFVYPVNPNFYTDWYTPHRISAFFNLILAVMIHIRKKGLLSNSDVQNVMQCWSVNSDPLYDFVASLFETCTGSTNNHYSKPKLHRAYIEWCKSNGIPDHKQKLTLNSFTSALQIHGFIPTQKKSKRVIYETYSTNAFIKRQNIDIDLDYASGSIF